MALMHYNTKTIRLDWKEGARVFTLELQSNNVGRFLQCLVLSSEGKIFLSIPREKEFARWSEDCNKQVEEC